jgi:formylglycine-generating enzyme required for sulfatase activity
MDYFGDQKQSEYLKLLASLRLRYEQKIKKENLSVSSGTDNFQQQAKLEKNEPPAFVDRGSYQQTALTKLRTKDTQKSDRKAGQKVEEVPSGKRPFPIAPIISGIALLAAILCIVGIASFGKGLISSVTPTAVEASTLTQAPTVTEASTEVATEAPTEMATETLTVTAPTLSPAIASSTPYAEKDGMTMIEISAGEFMLGSDKGDADEKPLQTMFLDAFSIDQTEVTNKMYSQCVTDGMCALPSHIGSPNEKVYYGNPKYENYPVIYVNWDMAKAYCQWAGRDLPTEFQWEKAARGTNGLIYPWGDKFDGRLLNYCDVNCANHSKSDNRYNDENVNLAPVGYYLNGASVYGVLDMSGNVWEWINDWYDVYPNGIPTASTYFGQKFHVIKGGSWVHNMYEARSSNRSYYSVGSDAFNDYTGFRCARPK